MIWQAVLVFVACAISDVLWAFYIKATAGHHTWLAACGSAAIVLVGCFSVVEYITNHVMIIPAAAGAFVGTATYLSFKHP